MLCIGRNECQSIVIGKPGDVLTEPIVIIAVPKNKGEFWRVGIEAQKDIRIAREELTHKPRPV